MRYVLNIMVLAKPPFRGVWGVKELIGVDSVMQLGVQITPVNTL